MITKPFEMKLWLRRFDVCMQAKPKLKMKGEVERDEIMRPGKNGSTVNYYKLGLFASDPLSLTFDKEILRLQSRV